MINENGKRTKENYLKLLSLVSTSGNIKLACIKLNICSRSLYKHLTMEQRKEILVAKEKFSGIGLFNPEKNKLQFVEGFNELFEKYLPGSTYRAAYERAEAEYIAQFNSRKYSNFESFRASRNQWLNIRKKNRGQSRQAA